MRNGDILTRTQSQLAEFTLRLEILHQSKTHMYNSIKDLRKTVWLEQTCESSRETAIKASFLEHKYQYDIWYQISGLANGKYSPV